MSSYADAGVDVEAGERAVDLMRARVQATMRPEVVASSSQAAAASGERGSSLRTLTEPPQRW